MPSLIRVDSSSNETLVAYPPKHWWHVVVDRNDCNRRVDGHERLYEIKRDTVQIPRGKGGVALEIHSTQLLRFLRCSSCSRRSFSPTWRVILWSLVGSTQP